MQNKIINIDDIAAEIAKMVKAETEDTKKAADESAKKAITKARDELRATSPRRTGKYARGWKTRKAEKFYETYNSTKPEITHLLNTGHAKQNGGRVPGDHHIDTAETNANRNFWDELNGRLK